MNARGLALAAFLYLILPLAQVWVYLNGLPFADTVDVANFAASIVAYHWLLANVLMGLKVPLLQNALPYDLRIRLHVWTTLGLVVFLAYHAVYRIFLTAKIIDVVSWSLMAVFSGLLVLSLLWIPLPGVRKLRTATLKLFQFGFLKSYDWMKAGHKLLFTALAGLTYVHIVQSQIMGLVPPAAALGYQLLFLVTAGFFLWTRIQNLTLPTLEVRSVATAGGIVRLALAPHPRLNYRSGQFAYLRFAHPDLKGEEHPFSFTTARHEDAVGFAVRASGDFTRKLSSLKPGDKVKVNGGFGAFHPGRGTAPLALIGSGVGAAPLLSILKEVSNREPDREVTVLLSVKDRSEMIEPATLVQLKMAMPRLKLKVFQYHDQPLFVPELLSQQLPDPKRYQYYVCSNDKVRAQVVGSLKTLGVKPGRIHFEAFNLG
jgi:predicted ferric reductase